MINELCSKNHETIDDFEDQSEDWIELINVGSLPVNLQAFWLSDEAADPQKWNFPAVTIDPQEHLLVFASKKDTLVDGELHCNFKLSSAGDSLFLFNNDNLIQELALPALQADHSYGFNLQGSLAYFDEPSPGEPNIYTSYLGYASFPEINPVSGRFEEAIQVLPTELEETVYRYTLDGNFPDSKSPILDESLVLDSTSVLTVTAFRPNFLPSAASHRTYLFGEDTDLPVASLIFPPAHFWGDDGLYGFGPHGDTSFPYDGANFWLDIKKPVFFEFFDENQQAQVQDYVMTKLHGGTSRAREMKSLRIMADKKVGDSSLGYTFFDETHYDDCKQIVLRNASTDFKKAHCRDGLFHHHLSKQQTGLAPLQYQPTIVFLNGQYWGIHNLRERLNQDYVAALSDVDDSEVDYLDRTDEVISGSAMMFDSLRTLVFEQDLSNLQNYESVQQLLDIENFIDYFIVEIYAHNDDWINRDNNTRLYRPQIEGGKWQFMLFDLDDSFSASKEEHFADKLEDVLMLAENEENIHAMIFAKLLEVPPFRLQFARRFCDLLNSSLTLREITYTWEEVVSWLQPEMQRHTEKWGSTDYHWLSRMEELLYFFKERRAYMFQHTQTHLNLEDTVHLDFRTQPEGLQSNFSINSLNNQSLPWQGAYFANLPIEFEIEQAFEGAAFLHWRIDLPNGDMWIIESMSSMMAFDSDANITAVFEEAATGQEDLLQSADLRILNNPVQAEILRYYSEAKGQSYFAVRDLSGRLLMQGPSIANQLQEIHIEQLPAGLYYLSVMDNTNGIQHQRFVKP